MQNDRSSVGPTLASPASDARGAPPGDPGSILAAALAQRKGKVSAQSGIVTLMYS